MNKKLKTQTPTKEKCYLDACVRQNKLDDCSAFYRFIVEGYS